MNMKKIYREIAKEYGVTVEEVKRDMQAAIEEAYKKPSKSDNEKNMQDGVPCKGKVPTTEEFLKYVINQFKDI